MTSVPVTGKAGFGHLRFSACRLRDAFVRENGFLSGPWVGFYTYRGERDKHRMDLGLTFFNGRISGEGNDDIGRFLIGGRFDAADGECYWRKYYIGAHDVFYRGFYEGRGIWGTWEILADAHGGFHIWPRANAEGKNEAISAEEGLVVPVIEVRPPTRRLVIRLVYNQI